MGKNHYEVGVMQQKTSSPGKNSSWRAMGGEATKRGLETGYTHSYFFFQGLWLPYCTPLV